MELFGREMMAADERNIQALRALIGKSSGYPRKDAIVIGRKIIDYFI